LETCRITQVPSVRVWTSCPSLTAVLNLHSYNRASLSINHFIIQTNAHNVKHVQLLKHIKIMEATPTCFGLQRNHHQGATVSA